MAVVTKPTRRSLVSRLEGWDSAIDYNFVLCFERPFPMVDYDSEGALPDADVYDKCLAVADHDTGDEDTSLWLSINGAWQRIAPLALVLGEAYVADNSGGSAQTIGTGFTKLQQLTSEGDSKNTTVDVDTNYRVTVDLPGSYDVDVSLSVSGTASRGLVFALYANGAEEEKCRCAVVLDASGNETSVAMGCTLDLAATEYVEVYMKASAASTDVLVEEGNLRVRRRTLETEA